MKSPGLNFSAKSGDQRFDSAIDDFALLLVRLVALLIQNVHAMYSFKEWFIYVCAFSLFST